MMLRNVRTYRKNGEIEIRFELVRMYTAFFHYSGYYRNGTECEKRTKNEIQNYGK